MTDHRDQPVITITLREVYDKLVELSDAVRGMPARVEKLETAVESLKKRVWLQTGGAAVAGTILGSVLMLAVSVLSR